MWRERKSGERVRRYEEGWKGGGGLKFLSVQCCREFGWFGCVENFVGKFSKDFTERFGGFSWFNFFEDGPLARALPPPPSNQPCAFAMARENPKRIAVKARQLIRIRQTTTRLIFQGVRIKERYTDIQNYSPYNSAP
jgi:Holliday junction resolvasome RuvABC ATP-dependent DNA helicase subunit